MHCLKKYTLRFVFYTIQCLKRQQKAKEIMIPKKIILIKIYVIYIFIFTYNIYIIIMNEYYNNH